jgi:hypothetical protein
MNEKFELENDLFVSVETESNGIETKYKFTFTDNKTKQSGTISITVNHFESVDFDDYTALDIATENSNKSFDEFFATLKDVSKISDHKNIAKFLPIAITEFRDLQKRKSKK